jgi:cytochrome c biogenesis protein CcmG, thiol:disulfide interchange protein DsbE
MPMKRPLVLAAVALSLAACTSDRGGPSGGDGSLLPEDRLALPEYDLAEYEALIGELRGTPVLVNFWGSWCPPCTAEAPHLAEASRMYEGRVQFLGVDILDNRRAARDFILGVDWQYPSIFDPEGEVRDGLGYVGQPITLIYDAGGILVFERVGTVTVDLLEKEFRKVL